MANIRSLLSLIAQNDARGLEDAATDALRFILSRSASARQALSEILATDCGQVTIAKVQTWAGVAHGAVPDLACHDSDGNLVAFIESKFWASLTPHQPVTYWQELPDDRPAVLLFLAPDFRIDEGWLWNELVTRLQDAGQELGPASTDAGLTTAPSKASQRRLMLTSWQTLLERMAEKATEDGDAQACFEIAELQGLAIDAIERDKPQRDANLKLLIADAVNRLEHSGWANTKNLSVGGVAGSYYVRYFRLAGASTGLRIDYKAAKQTPDHLLWLWFWRDRVATVGVEEVRSRLGRLAKPGLEWLREEVCVPIALPAGADNDATLDAIVSELERIAKLIDPDDPTRRNACQSQL